MNKTPLEIAALALGVIIIIGISAHLNGGYNGVVQGIQTATSSVFGGTSHPHSGGGPQPSNEATIHIKIIDEQGHTITTITSPETYSKQGYTFQSLEGHDYGSTLHVTRNGQKNGQYPDTLRAVKAHSNNTTRTITVWRQNSNWWQEYVVRKIATYSTPSNKSFVIHIPLIPNNDPGTFTNEDPAFDNLTPYNAQITDAKTGQYIGDADSGNGQYSYTIPPNSPNDIKVVELVNIPRIY